MGWKVKLDWTETELKHPPAWIKYIINDSVVFTGDELQAFEFSDLREFGTVIDRLMLWQPKLKFITKPVLRIITGTIS